MVTRIEESGSGARIVSTRAWGASLASRWKAFAALLAGALLALALPLGSARTEEAPSTADAAALLQEGERLAAARRYGEALESWRRAYLQRLPELRGLEFRYPLEAAYLPRSELREHLVKGFERDMPDEELEADRLAWIALGMVDDPEFDLKEAYLELLSAEIAGFYDPDTKKLYLIREPEAPKPEKKSSGLWGKIFGGGSSRFDPTQERAILSHEMTHALQDQHHDLYSMQRNREGDDDASLAFTALVEGEATLMMIVDMTASRGRDAADVLRGAAAFGSAPMEFFISLMVSFAGSGAFRRAPLVMRESLLFPYLKGLSFCGHLTGSGDWAGVDAAFEDPPLSTEQILHPRKYRGPGRDDPVAVRFRGSPGLGGRWKRIDENVIGELGIELLLREKLGKARSAPAAAGWDGDAYRLWKREGGARPDTVLVWASVWDREKDAEEFAAAIAEEWQGRPGRRRIELDSPVEGVPAPERAWSSGRGKRGRKRISALWRQGTRVLLVDRVPRRRLARFAAWALAFETAPKEIATRRFEPTVPFPGAGKAEAEGEPSPGSVPGSAPAPAPGSVPAREPRLFSPRRR